MPESPSQPAPLPPRRLPGFHGPWRKTTIGEVLKLGRGTPAVDELPLFNAVGLRTGQCRTQQRGQCVEEGDLLILNDGEYSGKVFTAPSRGYLGSTFRKIHLTSAGVDSRFFFYYLTTLEPLLHSRRKGTAIPHLNADFFSSLPLLLPPTLQEQRALADVLARAEAAQRAAQRAAQHHQALYQGLLQQLLPSPSQPTPLPPRRLPGFHGPWRKTTIGEVLKLGRGTPAVEELPLFNAVGLRTGQCRTQQRGQCVEEGDLLILNDGEYSGKVFTAPSRGYLGSTFRKIHLTSAGVDSRFLFYYLTTLEPLLHSRRKGTAIPHLNADFFSALPLLVPPTLGEQRALADVLARAEGLAHAASGRYARLQQAYQLLYQGLLQQLLPGPARPARP